jgi:hypothetical protein
MSGRPWKWMGRLCLPLALLAACGPTEQQKAKQAEAKRIECMDKFCPGDIEPKHDPMKYEVLKLHGQWYIGPKEYFSTGINGAAFEWWEHKPLPRGERRPPQAQALAEAGKGYDLSIEIFLTGRQRWPKPELERPWEHSNKENRWAELQQTKGLKMERLSLSPVLDVVRFRYPDGKPYDYTYYVATTRQRIRGSGPPVLSCLVKVPPQPDDFCTSGEFWQPDVYADFRFSAKHAQDWPAIHEEIVRVLSLARGMQPS